MKIFRNFSFSEPEDPLYRTVFWKRTEEFSLNAVTNVRALMLGALLIAFTLIHFGANWQSVALWMSLQILAGAWLLVLAKYYRKHTPKGGDLIRFLKIRAGAGSLVGLLYGASVFLLPDTAPGAALPTLMVILVVIAALAIFQYAILPAYYIVFNSTIFIPLALYTVFNLSIANGINLVLMVGALAILIAIGVPISRNAKEVTVLNFRLNNEVNEHVETKKQLEAMAMQDCLTGIGNRRLFENMVDKAIFKADRNQHALAILFVDLNDFKQVNDDFGHEVGDQVLILTGQRIEQQLRETDTVARMGGDEFAVLLPRINSRTPPPMLLKKLLVAIKEPITINGQTLSVTASIGMANYPEDGHDREALMRVADSSMYDEKNMHKMKLVT